MKREDTIKLYAEDFLKGKSDKVREAFYAKSLDKQYASIMAWKKRVSEKGMPQTATIGDVMNHLRMSQNLLARLNDLTPRDKSKIEEAMARIRESIEDFEATKRQRAIDNLEAEIKAKTRQLDKLRNND